MFAVVKIRGEAGLRRGSLDTLKMLRLNATNNCILLQETPSYKGMLKTVNDYVTYGEISKETLIEVLKKRLRLLDNKRVDENIMKDVTSFGSYEDFADVLLQGKVRLSDFKKLQPIFKLTPPSKGFKSVKEHYPTGDLGYRGNAINGLLEKMI